MSFRHQPSWPLCPHCEVKRYEKRIAELEAELAGHKARLAAINIYGDADIAAFKWQARAEKAEAEVERLRGILDECVREGWILGYVKFPKVNPSGDTLGKERDDG